MLVLVTGASGLLGRAVCAALESRGISIRGVDRRFHSDVAAHLELADVRDELSVYRLLDGCDAVVHLANHPNPYMPLSAQTLLSENVSMNANVFFAAADLGIKRVVFASSIQVTFARENRLTPRDPPGVPYLPADGNVPPNPGRNPYALSKEMGERMLELMARADAEIACTSLRFPMLMSTDWFERVRERGYRRPTGLSMHDFLAYLPVTDAGRLVALVLERQEPGYHRYFPAQSMQVKGASVGDVIAEHYPDAEIRAPLEKIESLIDLSALEAELGWQPEYPPLTALVD
jgi:nucleoside-diphosphate-sugar epimerase